jgi:hypothetical protein
LHPSTKQEYKPPKDDAEIGLQESNINFFKNNVLQALEDIISEFDTLAQEMNESVNKSNEK